MSGTNATTGKALDGIDHLSQSISDILGTRKGTRVMRRSYGGDLPALVDNPMNGETLLRIYAATVQALLDWEPRIILTKVTSASAAPGAVTLDLYGVYTPTGEQVSVSGVAIS